MLVLIIIPVRNLQTPFFFQPTRCKGRQRGPEVCASCTFYEAEVGESRVVGIEAETEVRPAAFAEIAAEWSAQFHRAIQMRNLLLSLRQKVPDLNMALRLVEYFRTKHQCWALVQTSSGLFCIYFGRAGGFLKHSTGWNVALESAGGATIVCEDPIRLELPPTLIVSRRVAHGLSLNPVGRPRQVPPLRRTSAKPRRRQW